MAATNTPSRNHFKVIVIGAGIAGCTAAKTLIENRICDITILEATGRVGGRVKTVNSGSGKCFYSILR